MYKFRDNFRIIIVFLFFILFSGCSEKYVGLNDEDLAEREILASWKELDCEIIEQDEKSFSLNCRVKDFVSVGDRQGLSKDYRDNLDKGEGGVIPFILGGLVGIGGFVGGGLYSLSDYNYTYDINTGGCWFAAGSCIVGAVMMYAGTKDSKSVKIMPDHVKIDTICVDGAVLSDDKVDIMIRDKDFEKIYYTNKNGNIELRFDEIITAPGEADSVLDLIIQYEELVDTVNVKIK
jgi:hypothetical protein